MRKIITLGIMLLFLGMTISSTTGIYLEKQTIKPICMGNILYVGGNGTGNYSKIQDAINDSSDGDTVFVYDDSSPYNESIKVNKSIKLIGENRETTIIEGHIDVSTNWVNISEFTIQRGITIFSCNNIIITDNNISNTFFSMGIWLCLTSNISIRFNNIHNNRLGLVVVECKNSIIEKNNFIDNRIHAYFSFIVRTFWDSNYWDNWIGIGAKLIFGSLGLIGIIPWVNFDWHPAQEPYDIGV